MMLIKRCMESCKRERRRWNCITSRPTGFWDAASVAGHCDLSETSLLTNITPWRKDLWAHRVGKLDSASFMQCDDMCTLQYSNDLMHLWKKFLLIKFRKLLRCLLENRGQKLSKFLIMSTMSLRFNYLVLRAHPAAWNLDNGHLAT